MADNLSVKDGSGATVTVAADDISSVYYPRQKMVWGADGAVNDVSAAAPMPVTSASLPLPSGASTAAKQPALGTAGTASSDVITVQGISGGTPQPVVGYLDNPTSVLTRVSDTNAYAQNDLIATSTTAGSVAVPSITVARIATGSLMIRRLRLTTNKTSGWADTFRIGLWSAAPTFTNGDNGAFAVATGAAGFLGYFDVTLVQFADGASGVCVPTVGGEVGVKLASGSVIYWTLQYTGAAGVTPASAQTFTLTAETYQN